MQLRAACGSPPDSCGCQLARTAARANAAITGRSASSQLAKARRTAARPERRRRLAPEPKRSRRDATTAGSVSNTSSATQVSHLEVEGKIGVAAVLGDAEDVDVLVLEYFQGQRYGGSEQIFSVR